MNYRNIKRLLDNLYITESGKFMKQTVKEVFDEFEETNYDIENYEHRQAILALNGFLAVGFFNNWGRIRAQDHINKVIRHIRMDTANTV